MNLIGDEFIPNKPDNSKTIMRIILIAIIALVVSIVIILIILAVTKEEKLTVTIDGKANKEVQEMLIFEDDGTIHIPIRDIAEHLGYKSYAGNYKEKSENSNECYVVTTQEIASFVANSNTIEKIDVDTEESTYFTIKEEVQMKNGKLYTTQEGISEAFNVIFSYDEKNKKVVIQTLPYLVSLYKDPIIELGYKDISNEFNDQKTILKDLAIVKDEEGNYGLLNTTNDQLILETKYSKISYIPVTDNFLVESNRKKGIYNNKGEEQIKIQYDSIELVNQSSKLYVVSKDKRYGVITENEDIKIPINFDSIGIDIRKFQENDLTNKYIILDKLIPVKKNDYWGLYNIDGEKITDYIYTDFGCMSSSKRNSANVLIIPDYKVIVGKKDNGYYIVNQLGEELFNGISFDEVYMLIDNGEKTYNFVRNKKTYDGLNLLEKLMNRMSNNNDGEQQNGEKNNNDENQQSDEENNNDEEQQNDEENNNGEEQQNDEENNNEEQQNDEEQ